MRKRQGFTLIELLVVVSIIAILSAIGLAVFTNAQKGARDARRRADMRAMQSASELYYQSTGYYSGAVPNTFLENNIVPTDPKTGAAYTTSFTASNAYSYCALLEVTASSFCVENLQ